MTPQAREVRTGRYTSHDRSAPEARLHPVLERAEIARLEGVLGNLSETFVQLQSILDRGHDAFHGDDFVVRFAAVMALIRLGEQAKRLGREFTAQNPGPQYSLMAQQRDYLAHRFHSVDWDLIWGTLTIDVPRDSVSHRYVEAAFLRTTRRLAASRAVESTDLHPS